MPYVAQLKRSKKWVVMGCRWADVRWCGPEPTKAKAEELKREVIRAEKFEDRKRGWKS